MSEEFKGGPKNKWSRIYRKKWFFPAVYLTIAALLLSVVVWYQNMDNQVPDATDDQEQSGDYSPVLNDDEAQTVLDQQELIQMPVVNLDEAEIVTKFFDYNAEQEDRENALVLYNNRFYQSTGVDIAAANAEVFDVVAALSGTVEEVKEDPLLGNVVILSHADEVKTYYASLDEVSVTAGSDLKQGDKVGTAGKNLFGKDNGTHVHFEIRKDGKEMNPETYFNQPVSSLESVSEEAEGDSAVNEESDAAEDAEANEETNATEEDSEANEESDATNDSEEESPESGEDETEEDPEEETDDSTENDNA
ncbi:M23 family metallopeptidase [Oceanobacillus massiliensis]|uniref:M23 family metallopeptidase n=1 Tax=Oceanobacillus massiliensis TaxID=1465765 RepID=UPI000288819E|nr:M23 family metallopeptidase [Oceanobacillus massiliensis]